jgi:hypothetical protein
MSKQTATFALYDINRLDFITVVESVDIIEKKRLQWYGRVKRMQEERLPKLIMEWIPGERRKRGCPRRTWIEGVRAVMEIRHLEAGQWLNRKEWCLGSGRRRQLSQDWRDRQKVFTARYGLIPNIKQITCRL